MAIGSETVTHALSRKARTLPIARRSSAADKPLRILCLNYEYPPMGGGAGNATRHTALELNRRDHHVDVLTSRLPQQSDVEIHGRLTVYRVYSRRRSIHQAGLLGAVTYLISAMPKLRRLARANDYDIYHFYFGLPTGLLALYVHWVLRKPYVIALRGSDVPGYDNTQSFLRPLHFLLRPLSHFIWSRAAAVTALSDHLRALARSTISDVDIAVIRNAVDTEMFPRRPNRSNDGTLRLICVCRLIRRKGLHHLIHAVHDLRDQNVHLEIVGSGEQSRQLRALVESLGLEKHVNLTGYVPRERLADHYNSADIFVLPSISESFGQVLLEAMSSGLPVIASRVGGIPEVVEHGAGGLLIEPGSREAIVGAIRQLAAQPELRRRMGNWNYRQAHDKHHWSAIAREYEQLYFEAVGRFAKIGAAE